MLSKRLVVALAALVSLAMLTIVGCGSLGGEKYPTKQVTYMTTFDPGGQSDREARRQQPYLEKALGQKVVIDYKVGGGGAMGWAEAARGKQDGYQITGINIPHIILQPMQQDVGYKTEQLLPISLFQSTPQGLMVLKNSPYKDLKSFIDAAKKNPGKLTIGGSSTWSGSHIAALRLEKLTGAKFEYVPFTGAAPSITAFLGGHVDSLMANSDDMVKYKDQSIALGIASEDKFTALPEAKTFKEQGIDMVEIIARGIAVPAGTPDTVVSVLDKVFLDIAKNPEIIEAQKKEGFAPIAMNSKEAKAYIEKLIPIYKELTAGLKK
ncbi:MAG TPA: tripartite tricarboxylate transporter substrate binding protein [Chloroflexota bacterium]|nr:tripartite tricarboxylate transporter substrate binding protein [Chloroflexota bacterium]